MMRPLLMLLPVILAAGEADEKRFVVEQGSRVPLAMINSVSAKNAKGGEPVYLETVFPVLAGGRIAIPVGSHVRGTVTQVKRAGRVKGRSELFVRFEELVLPNGVTREFRSRIGGLDGRATEELDGEEGKLKGEGNKRGDVRTVGEAAAGGTTIGAIAGSTAGRAAMGAGVGAAAGAAAGLIGVLVTRGPDAMLTAGTTLDMVLDRNLEFTLAELDFSERTTGQRSGGTGPGPASRSQRQGLPVPGGGAGNRIP